MMKRTSRLARPALIGAGILCFFALNLRAQPFAPAEVGTSVNGFQDDFNGSSLDSNWAVRGDNAFSVSGGLLHIAPANGDPNHLLYEVPGYSDTVQEVLTRIRVINFGTGGYPRGGLGAGVDPTSSRGINFTFRDDNSEGQVGRHTAFLDDFRTWGPGQNFVWETNVWYWMRLRHEPNAASQGGVNDVFAKIWPADGGTPEPATWQLTWDYTPANSPRAGYAGIQAGSEADTSGGLAEFDVDYVLIKAAELPSIVVAPGAFLPIPVSITNQPQSQIVLELAPATFSVGASGNPQPTYQWYQNEALIPGATEAAYSIARSSLSDDQARFKVVVANIVSNVTHSVTSTVATLSVLADTNPPVLLGAQSIGLSQVQVLFSERMAAATVTNLAHYALAGTNGSVPIFNATLDATQTNVILNVSQLTENASYTLTVNGLTDQAAAANPIAANSRIDFTPLDYHSRNIGGAPQAATVTATNNGYTIAAGGQDIGGTADQFHFSYQLRSGDFDVRVRLESLSQSDAWAKAGLMARETTNANSRFASVLATPGIGGSFFLSRAAVGAQALPAGFFPVNYPNTWLRLQRTGNLFTGYASLDGESWAQLGAVSLTLSNTLYFGMAVTSHHASQTTTAQFRDLAPATGGTVGPAVPPFEPLAACSRRTGLVLSELMYHPAPRADGKNLEFVEVFNSQAFDEDLSGHRLSGDIDFAFPPGTILPAGAYLVVAKSPAEVQSVYGIAGVLGPYANNLPNDSGTVRLRNEQDSILLEVNYDSQTPWPRAADGAGHSLFLAHASYGEGDPRAWDISDAVGGSPGRLDSFRPSRLRAVSINEVLANSGAAPAEDFVELHNASNQSNDISGCILTDNPDRNKFAVAPGTVIPPRGFVCFTRSQLGFGLKAGGDTVYLKNPDASRVLDAVRLDAQPEGTSLGRWPDGASAFYLLATPTPGAANARLRLSDIVINELMYHPISNDDDDQFIELFNQGTNTVDLGGWQFVAGIKFTFPPGMRLAPQAFIVVARDMTNLFVKYPNLNPDNTAGNFSGALSHSGERVALAMPQTNFTTNAQGLPLTNTLYAVVDEVTYADGGRWGQWSDGGGSSLELIDSRAHHRLPSNWADSDETAKAPWTTIEHTGVLDLGSPTFAASGFQVLLQGEGECLVDNVEVIRANDNLVVNGSFETGSNGWLFEGNHEATTLETAGGFNSARSLHLRASGQGDSYANRVRTSLTSAISAGATATLRAKVRWLRGHPEILLRLRGNWLEAAGPLMVPPNLGTPGAPNSRAVSNAGPAIFDVVHNPVLPVANQAVIVRARVQDPDGLLSVQLKYRVDPAAAFTTVTMGDDGTGGDALAGDGVFSAILPAQPANALVAFYVEAADGFSPSATARFPGDAPAREALVRFGESQPFGGFGAYRLWLTQATFNRWSTRRKTSNQPLDCTFVNGAHRVIYNVGAYYSGSPWKSAFGIIDTPTGNMCDYHLGFPSDDRLLGATSIEVAFPGNVDSNNGGIDHTAQAEPISYWLARQLGLHYIAHRYVHLFINGVRRGSIIYDTQGPNRDMIQELFPNDAQGDLFEGSFWFEADASDMQGSSYGDSFATMTNFRTTGGVKKTARYRWNFPRHGVGGSANNYTNWFRLVDALNGPTTGYTEAVEAIVDTEQWMRVFAYEHLINNWEAFGFSHGVNMFFYKGQQGRWTVIPTDVDISFRGQPSDLFWVDDPVLQRMSSHPPFRRAYWRALQDAANGPLASTRVNPLVDARYAALRANGLEVTSPDTDPLYRIKPFITSLRNYVMGQLATVAVNFTVSGPTAFNTNTNLVTLSGTAPVAVKTLALNGVAWPVTWTSVKNWTLRVPLNVGTNPLDVVGYDLRNQVIAGASNRLTIVYTGSSVTPVDAVSIIRSGNQVNLAFDAIPGHAYRVDYKDALDALNWTELKPAQVATGSFMSVPDLVAGVPQRFYRVMLVR